MISHGKHRPEPSMDATVVNFSTIANSSGRIRKYFLCHSLSCFLCHSIFFSYLYKFFSSICFFQHFFVIEILCLLSSFCSIGIEAWIKQSFRMTSVDRMCWIIGTLTDGESKIHLRFRDISKPQSFDLFQMGDKVQVEGFVDVDGNLFLFEYFSN